MTVLILMAQTVESADVWNPENPAYDPTATYDDGSCLVGGCMIEEACNFNPEAEYQLAGACEFTSCAGCMDPVACNYDDEATIDGFNCEYPDAFYNCDGSCVNDTDGTVFVMN